MELSNVREAHHSVADICNVLGVFIVCRANCGVGLLVGIANDKAGLISVFVSPLRNYCASPAVNRIKLDQGSGCGLALKKLLGLDNLSVKVYPGNACKVGSGVVCKILELRCSLCGIRGIGEKSYGIVCKLGCVGIGVSLCIGDNFYAVCISECVVLIVEAVDAFETNGTVYSVKVRKDAAVLEDRRSFPG